ncbi:predicted protein [Uncinocarpus reesii 1704]|uniref:CRIB domain-containing protein n=1 Tax=Uncinocarpus reesii (strain UAMH 1704) TaxID=336963 RepID=C4JMU4_UNCRE|nr:uncharacterized protein UREG_04152 [Uncinocarpus reesii 1704]EEP79306.1 predicted protein [Uncinocarpus reesii 1704]
MSFLNLDSTSTSPRPNTASSQSLLASSFYNDRICRQTPSSVSSPSTLPDISAGIRLRSRTHSPKRFSVFRNRSRSNTATSTSSSYQSPASSMTSIDASSRRSSQDGRSLSSFFSPAEKESLTKSLLSRGSRILKRQGSKASLVSLVLEQEEEMVKVRSRERSRDILGSKEKEKQNGPEEFVRKNISEPFNFQHVTHTSQSQLPPIEYTHPHDLATEFSIIRASQRPGSQLKGIRAESLFYRNCSSDDLSTTNLSTLAPDSQSLYTRSPPHSPIRTMTPSSPRLLNHSRASRSVENFSRPVSRTNKPTSAPCIIPPPRVSSRSACSRPADPTSLTIDALLGIDSPSTGQEQYPSHFEATRQFPDEIVHAYTTDDYSPKIPGPSPVDHVSGLANIPEENESWRNSRTQVTGRADSPAKLHHQPLYLLTVDSVPGADDAHSPIIASPESNHKQLRATNTLRPNQEPSVEIDRVLEDSWEDDIDYCYEHAAESNSNFDWQRVSFEEVEERLAATSLRETDVTAPSHECPQRLGPFQSFGPFEESKSIPTTPEPQLSLSFPRPGSVSPGSGNTFEYFNSPGKKLRKYKSDVFQVLGPPLEDRLSPSPMYGGMMPDIQESDEEVVYAQPDDSTASTRNSCSPLSKCNSQESMILSRAASIARKHRSSTSTNSVPDLIHSPNGSRETVNREASNGAVEQVKVFAPRSPAPGIHARCSSLARDVVRTTAGTSSDTQSFEKPSVPLAPFHDRAKSASILDTFDTSKHGGPALRNRPPALSRGANHRKTRTSYSLFPTADPPTPK